MKSSEGPGQLEVAGEVIREEWDEEAGTEGAWEPQAAEGLWFFTEPAPRGWTAHLPHLYYPWEVFISQHSGSCFFSGTNFFWP